MAKLKAGIVGLGRLGYTHAQDLMFKIPEVELVAACSVVPEELDRVKDWGIELFSDYSTMIKEAPIDAVFIISPSALHPEQIIEALNAGKHVFSEKPLGTTLEDCIKVEEECNKHPELKFQLGFMRRFDPSYEEAKAKVDSGTYGKPFMIKTTSNDPLETIEGFLKFAPQSGGPWLDMSVHDVDLAMWYFGEEVESVYAIGGGFLHPELEEFGCADNACALIKFKNGNIAQMHVGYSAPNGYQVETEILMPEGNLRISAVPAKDRIEIYGREGVLVECDPSWPARFSEAFLREKQHFVNCVLNDETPSVGAADGTRTTRVALALTEAFESGEVVKL